MKTLFIFSFGLTLWSGLVLAQTPHRNHGSGSAQREAALSQPARGMGGFQVHVIPLDPSKTIVGIQVKNTAGQVLNPGSVPLELEYVAQNTPFTGLATSVSGTQLVGSIPSSVQGSYTVRVTLRWNGDKHQQRFFINRGNNNQQRAR